MKKTILSTEQQGRKVALCDQGNGFVSVEYTEPEQSPQIVGVYHNPADYHEAMRAFHQHAKKVWP